MPGCAMRELLSIELLGTLASTLLFFAGLAFLRWRWLQRSSRLLTLAGWLLVGAGFYGYIYSWGDEAGTAYALLAFSAVAFLVVWYGLERRVARVRPGREVALEPEDRPTNWPRAIAKSFLALVLAGVAAVGIGVAFAIHMPLVPTDRIVIGGLLVPMLWGAGMAWTLSDAKLVRATLLLAVISAAAYAAAFLPKMLSA
jgi:hypothetical protein